VEDYHLRWLTQSRNSAESMPLGGHSIGCNVWVENSEVLLYLQQSGSFDENGSMLKAGRVRIGFGADPFAAAFLQELVLTDGYIRIEGQAPQGSSSLRLWVDAHNPVVHVRLAATYALTVSVQYETWRSADRAVDNQSYELFQCKEVWGDPNKPVVFRKDHLEVTASDEMLFYHRNRSDDLSFDREMDTQGLAEHKARLYNPQHNLTTGGLLKAPGMLLVGASQGRYVDTDYVAYRFESMQPTTEQDIAIYLHTAQAGTIERWKTDLHALFARCEGYAGEAFENTRRWWRAFWARSYILINPAHPDENDPLWQVGRNYQLFRFMLGCNHAGVWPTKFNGGLFTFDPILAGDSPWSDIKLHYTPDYRLWGGGSHTIQNQRLLYWPMLKSGDFAMLPQLFDFFNRLLPTARTRARHYFDVDGAHYPEQIGIYGLCPTCDHGWGNTTGLPVPQIRYHFSSQLEIATMMLAYAEYTGDEIAQYIDFIESVVMFYDGFYPQNDDRGKMIIEPGNALETYHPVRNPIDGIAGLDCLLRRMLALPVRYASPARRASWQRILERVPPISFTETSGRKIIAYADTQSALHNCEIPELYPVFPYDQFGIGKPGLQIAIDTAHYAPTTEEQLTHISWHQQGIHYARLGMLPEAMSLLVKKMGNADMRVPVYWGPGHDWTPDHNWGGSGMIQLQEMLLQADGDVIYLLPCWDKNVDVTFRLHAPGNTVVECTCQAGRIVELHVTPTERQRDLILPVWSSAL
jgi:hypothetical protein